MKKNKKTASKGPLVVILLVSLFVFGTVIWAGWLTSIVTYNNNQVQVSQVRDLVLDSARLSKIPVPVDPKTGDLYFAELKLFLPAKEEDLRLNYGHQPSSSDTAGSYDVSVSSDYIFTQSANKLYAAQDLDELFKAVPKLQACQRGVRIIEKQTPEIINDESLVLKEKVQVSTDRVVYLYSEKLCPDLEEVVYHLKDLRAY